MGSNVHQSSLPIYQPLPPLSSLSEQKCIERPPRPPPSSSLRLRPCPRKTNTEHELKADVEMESILTYLSSNNTSTPRIRSTGKATTMDRIALRTLVSPPPTSVSLPRWRPQPRRPHPRRLAKRREAALACGSSASALTHSRTNSQCIPYFSPS